MFGSLDLAFFALAVPVVLMAGVSKGGFGASFDIAAAPILALMVDPGLALGLMLPLLMLMDVAAVRAYWGRWARGETRRLILAGVPGVLAGVLLWQFVDADLLRLLIGAMALVFVAFQVAVGWRLFSPRSKPWPAGAGYLFGALSGFGSFIAHAGGPAAVIYLLAQRLEKTAYQATIIAVFTAVNFLKLPAYFGLGLINSETIVRVLPLAPVALAGVWLGVRAHRIVSERVFFAVAYTLLAVVGVKLIVDALSA